jgi:hypothetical protein
LFQDWANIAKQIKINVRKHLWSASRNKYRTHIYLNGSPFSKDFDEDIRLYSGGSICAIIAGFNTISEVKEINKQLRFAASREKFATIGMTVYPPYPVNEFPNMKPYLYQNAGDWTWFGGRIVEALLPYHMAEEAYDDLKPMLERTIKHGGFFEWYDVQNGRPKGSGNFRGEAGILYEAITKLKAWANKNK